MTSAAVVALFGTEYVLETLADILNLRKLGAGLPAELRGLYDDERYVRTQAYLRDNTRLAILQRTTFVVALLAFILAGGFGWADRVARLPGWGEVGTGLVLAGLLGGLKLALTLPFSAYSTFSIEARYGFNRMTPALFAADLVRGILISAVLAGGLFAAILGIFVSGGDGAWLLCWALFTVFYLLLSFLAPAVLMPIFNRFEPLPEGELRAEIERYLAGQDFRVSGVYLMDGSKRSTKANAFFAGFGRFRRLVLFDTLVARHTVAELVAVLAHEIGHFKLRHILKSAALSIASAGALFWLLQRAAAWPWLFEAFRAGEPSLHLGILLALVLFGPVGRFLGVPALAVSRRFEYEADRFAARTYGRPDVLAEALRKLSVDHLSNPAPHGLKVLLDYSHPPILNRLEALRR
jgi:STE24 endopeptidase